jgi:hypothetical protein
MLKNLDNLKELKTVVWDEKNDRYIFIERNWNGYIIGLNFMQGNDKKSYEDCQTNDIHLLNIYHYMNREFSIESSSIREINFINKVIWMRHNIMDVDLLCEINNDFDND